MDRATEKLVTIRDLLNAKFAKLTDIDKLGEQGAARELVELSSLLASINKEVVERNFDYNQLCKKVLDEIHVAAKAKITAQASEEWHQWMTAIGYQKATLDNIRALKYYLRQIENEQREAKY